MGRKNKDSNQDGAGSTGGTDPNKLPPHLRNMVGSAGPSIPAGAGAAKSAPGAGVEAQTATGGAPEPFQWGRFLRNWWFLLIAMPLIIFVRFYVWSPFKIPSGSMEPQMLGNEDNGDRVVVDLTAYRKADPQRWDIAVFKSPELKQNAQSPLDSKDIDYVKRCVGVAGDRIVISGGDLYNVTAGPDGKDQFELLRKPPDLQRTIWHTLYNFPYDSPWETPDPLMEHGEWEVTPPGACTAAADRQSFHLAQPDGGTWTLHLRRTATPMLQIASVNAAPPPPEPAAPVLPAAPAPPPVPVGPIIGPIAPGTPPPAPVPVPQPTPALPGPSPTPPAGPAGPNAPANPDKVPAGPFPTVSVLSNRYLKPGDYWFRIPKSKLSPWRTHIRGSQSVLVVPDDIQPEFGAKPGVVDPQAKQWKSKRLFPIPLEWYAGNAEIETRPPQSELDREAELWQLDRDSRQAYANFMDSAARESVAKEKRGQYKGISLRIGQAYGGQFSVNDLRIELALDVKTWGKRFDLTVDEELSADGSQVLRRYGLRIEQGQGLPWVEEFDAATGAFRAVAQAGSTVASLPMGIGAQRLALEHVDGAIRLVLLDGKTGMELQSTGFTYTRNPRAMKQFAADLRLTGEGSDVVFEKIQIARDLYYLWDEFKLMEVGRIACNLRYRTSNENFPQMPDGFLVHRADGLTEFALKPAATPQDRHSGYLMCGDNTVSSVDGRYFGPVERWRFSGKYWFTAWPPSRAGSVR